MPIEVFSPVIKGQLRYHHPSFSYVDCERDFSRCYKRMREDKCGGFVLPAFMVETLNQQGRVVEVFNSSVCMPPPGQGGLALVTRKADRRTGDLAGRLNDPNVFLAVSLERKFAEDLKSKNGCVGALCSISGIVLNFSAVIVNPDGSEKIERTVSGEVDNGEKIVAELIGRICQAGQGKG
jgi:porphobilinogen deaminase